MNALMRQIVLYVDGYKDALTGDVPHTLYDHARDITQGITQGDAEDTLLMVSARESYIHPLERLQVDHIDGRSKRGPSVHDKIENVISLSLLTHAKKTRETKDKEREYTRSRSIDGWLLDLYRREQEKEASKHKKKRAKKSRWSDFPISPQ